MNITKTGADQYCAVCLQNCHHPTQLPCGHIFCFLCVKGITIQSKKCAMCRAAIPSDYLNNPVLLNKIELGSATMECENVYQWYYEGRNGWWKYDERSNMELETSFNAGSAECMLLLAGAVYCIDFGHMVQFRRTDPSKRRRVRRDKPTLQAKGIAGIKITDTRPLEPEAKTENENNDHVTSHTNEEIIVIPDEAEDDDVTIVSTMVSVHSQSDDTSNIIQRLSSMNLTEESLTHTNTEVEET